MNETYEIVRANLPAELVEKLQHETHASTLEVTLQHWLISAYPLPDPQDAYHLLRAAHGPDGHNAQATAFCADYRAEAYAALRAAQAAYTRNRGLETCLRMLVAERNLRYVDRDSLYEYLHLEGTR